MPDDLELKISVDLDTKKVEEKFSRIAERFNRLANVNFNVSNLESVKKKIVSSFEEGAEKLSRKIAALQANWNIAQRGTDFGSKGYKDLANYWKNTVISNMQGEFGNAVGGLIGKMMNFTADVSGKIGSVVGGIAGGPIGSLIGGALKTLVGLVGVGVRGIMRLVKIGSAYSGYGKAMFRLIDTTFKLALKPLADVVGMILVPILVWVMKKVIVPFIKKWDEMMKTEGAQKSATAGGFAGAAIGLAFGGPLGTMIGLIAGGLIGVFINWFKQKVEEWSSQLRNVLRENTKIQGLLLMAKGVSMKLQGYFFMVMGKFVNALVKFYNVLLSPVLDAVSWLAEKAGLEDISEKIEGLKASLNDLASIDFSEYGRNLENIGSKLLSTGAGLFNAPEGTSVTEWLQEYTSHIVGGKEILEKWKKGNEDLSNILIEWYSKNEVLEVDVEEAANKTNEVLDKIKNESKAIDNKFTNQVVPTWNRTASSIILAGTNISRFMIYAKDRFLDFISQAIPNTGSGGSNVMPFHTMRGGEAVYARQTGGVIPETGMYLMHEGEIVLPRWLAAQAGVGQGSGVVNNISVNVNVDRISNDVDLNVLADELADRIMREIEIRGGL